MESLQAMLERRTYEQGAYLCREGEPAETQFFILSGQVSVNVPLEHRRAGRIATTISAGSAFGEMAMLDRGKRSADVLADSYVTCLVLYYDRLESETSLAAAQIRMKLFTNFARVLTNRLRQATREIKTLRN